MSANQRILAAVEAKMKIREEGTIKDICRTLRDAGYIEPDVAVQYCLRLATYRGLIRAVEIEERDESSSATALATAPETLDLGNGA